jgi:putative membrane protein
VTGTGLASLGTISKGLSATFGGISNALGSIAKALDTSNGNLSQLSATLASANISLSGTKDAITDMRGVIGGRLERLNQMKGEEGYEILSKLLAHDPEEIGSFMASPVEIETEAVYEVDTYGSSMAPFYTVLALWVGGLILVAIIHTKVEMEPSFKNAKPHQQFFGRYITFFLIAQVQALITVLGDLYFIGIECAHPFLFWLAASCSSFVFGFLMYALTAAFGNIGEALGIVLLVIQVAGSGGTFPIEVLPNAYQIIYRFLLFPYSMDALRECIAGMYRYDYIKNLAFLSIYIVVSLIIGLFLQKPFEKLNHMIERSKEKSGVML